MPRCAVQFVLLFVGLAVHFLLFGGLHLHLVENAGSSHACASLHSLVLLQEFGVVSYTLLLSLIEYKTAVMREDMEAAAQILPSIPKVCFV